MASSARSRPSATASRQSRGGLTPLPAYQAPRHALNESAQRALQNLHRDHKLDSLKHRLKAANNHLTSAAADVNDRFQIQNANYTKDRKRLEKQGTQESEELDTTIAGARQDTDAMTGELEESVRKIIDAGAEVEGVEDALRELQENVTDGRGRIVPTQSTLGANQSRPNNGRRRQGAGLDDEESEGDDGATQPIGENDSLIGVLRRKVAEQKAAYQASSMAHRYAHHNDYIGFKQIVHDAHYPEQEAPPMPNASTWFPSSHSHSPDSSNPTTAAAAGNGPIDNPSAASDDDLAVASERVSIKCPITLLPMTDPVTSEKCPHSFEKEAILSMLNASDVRIGGNNNTGGRRGGGAHDASQKAMKCPVCEVLFTATDLHPNPVLVRKIKRIQAALNRQNEAYPSSDSDSSEPGSRNRNRNRVVRPEDVGSSPAASRTMQFKSERRSQVPVRGGQSREVSMVPNTQVEDVIDLQ